MMPDTMDTPELFHDMRLNAVRVNDTRMAQAYEAVGDAGRAWFKTTMALTRALHGEAPSRLTSRVCPAGAGFEFEHRARPADRVLVLVNEGFAAPVRLCAALMTARLAGVDMLTVLAVRPADGVLTALELLGVDDIFAVDAAPKTTERLLLFGTTAPKTTERLLLFGTNTARLAPESADCRTWRDTPPRLQLDADCPPEVEQRLCAVHPDALLVQSNPDVLYTARSGTEADGILRLHPNLWGAWSCPGLTPAFFAVSSLNIIPTT